jgi:hypothetical protein
VDEIMKVIAARKACLAEHPFFTRWVRLRDLPADTKFMFAPIMANFVMNFRDMNKWFIRFGKPKSVFEEVINGNTYEDETHSRLFLEDWEKLELDDALGWRASDMIWWLFLAAETEPFRGFGMRFSRMCIADGGDVLMRFAHSEAGEACGNCFFEAVAPEAEQLAKMTRLEYRYFGHYHLDREKGHVIKSEGLFEHQPLPEAQQGLGLELMNKMFDIFFEMFDSFYAYAVKYAARGLKPRRIRAPHVTPAIEATAEPAAEAALERPVATPGLSTRGGREELSAYQAEAQRLLERRKVSTAAHPFYAWLRDENGISPKNKLQRFMPMWVMDIMGYRDLNHYALRYDEPKDDGERAINRWIDSLSTHSVLFLNDWDALGMDDIVDWTGRETMEFLFLDPGMDIHRENAATFIKLAMTHTQPMRRFWMMEALEASGEAFFLNTRQLASEVEASTGLRLDYFGDRHDVVHPPGAIDPRAVAAAFKAQSMTSADRDVAIDLIRTVFDAIDVQLSLSLDIAQRNKFNVPDFSPERLARIHVEASAHH